MTTKKFSVITIETSCASVHVSFMNFRLEVQSSWLLKLWRLLLVNLTHMISGVISGHWELLCISCYVATHRSMGTVGLTVVGREEKTVKHVR